MGFADMKANSLLEKILSASAKQKEDPVPIGFKSASELSVEWGVGIRAAERACKRGLHLGILRRVQLMRCIEGRMYRVNYYTEVKR